MKNIHGGDVYNNKVNMDFSVNINPLGIPAGVKAALKEAADYCDRYPDMGCGKLRQATSEYLIESGCAHNPDNILFGNGASELFMAIVHAVKPEKAAILAPSFYGYEYASKAAGAKVVRSIDKSADILFLANPNNPTGELTDIETLTDIISFCSKNGIYVVLDECFIEFCKAAVSAVPLTKQYDNLIVVRAFTKIFAIPGVRLGYLVCGNELLYNKIQQQLPEWNVSVLAQSAGIACLKEQQYIEKTVSYVKEQREFLDKALRDFGFKVYGSEADFILFYSDIPLYGLLLQKGILIRDCSNYEGLKKGHFRIAVKTAADNARLVKAIGECIEEYRESDRTSDRTFTADGD